MTDPTTLCPCCSQLTYQDCCLRFISGNALPTSTEQLMRSRYSAFAKANADYLLATLAPSHREPKTLDDIKKTIASTRWLGLKVLSSRSQGDSGQVEFVAFFEDAEAKVQGQLHELSDFVRTDGRWYYTHGQALAPIKWQRNDLCFCGSGKKYKKCCLA